MSMTGIPHSGAVRPGAVFGRWYLASIATASLLIVGLLAWNRVDSFWDIFNSVMFILFVVLPASILLVAVLFLRRKWPRSWLNHTIRVLFVPGLLTPSILLGTALGLLINEHEVREAKQFCAALVPALEAYKTKHGGYPDAVSAVLPQDSQLPRLLRGREFYSRNNNEYYFQVLDKSKFFSGLRRESWKKEWD